MIVPFAGADGLELQDDAIIDRLFETGGEDMAIGRIDGIQYVDGVSVIRLADADVRI